MSGVRFDSGSLPGDGSASVTNVPSRHANTRDVQRDGTVGCPVASNGIMTGIRTSRGARLLLLAVVCAGLLAGGLLWYGATRQSPHAEAVGEVVGEVVGESSTREGWKTIEYQRVQVDVPADWQRVDMDNCGFHFEHWGPPDSADCGSGGGVAFYASAIFDSAHRPGVSRTDSNDSPAWGGYVYAGDFAVYASDDRRALVRKVLKSVRAS